MAPDGYVSWRAQIVEHYCDEKLRTSNGGRRQALKIAHRCRILEDHGQPVNSTTFVWTWREPA